MDSRTFDDLTRSLAAPKTRRGLLGGLAALVAGVRVAGAQTACPIPGQTRNRKGQCQCPAGTDPCPEGCFDRKRDPNNCGSCGNVCINDEVCLAGSCECNCGPGFDCIAGICSPSEPTGITFNAAAAHVWQALTDGETLTSLGISSDIAPRVGHRFQIRPASGAGSKVIEAEMIEVEAPRRFVFKWTNGPLPEPTTVTITLDSEQDDTVTRFRLSHTDASGATCQAGALVLGRNWGHRLFKEALPRYLHQGRLQ